MSRGALEDGVPKEAPNDAIAALIRQSSESGRLMPEDELCRKFAEQDNPGSCDRGSIFPSALTESLGRYEDLCMLMGGDGARWYYSSRTMTGSYAVLLLQMQYDLTGLIVEVVRQNSAFYPKPVPVDTFKHSPFEMTDEQIEDCLKGISAKEEYRDIAAVITSASNTFLYSTLHLEPDHASMLAEWFDVGLHDNP